MFNSEFSNSNENECKCPLEEPFNILFLIILTSSSENPPKFSFLNLQRIKPLELDETKILFCFEGKVLDVIIDLRPKSLTYMQVNSFLLDADKPSILIVPEQCAHGFITLEDNSGKQTAHADYIYEEIKTFGLDFDTEIEAKAKDLAVLRYREQFKVLKG